MKTFCLQNKRITDGPFDCIISVTRNTNFANVPFALELRGIIQRVKRIYFVCVATLM